ncbi:putative non-specific serine/threonine protein kinase [Helianthus annuus]|nr:putative non-specific serine/threonine protein kinase [Helianthus annuus]
MMVTDLRWCRLSELRRRAIQRRAAEAKVSSEEEEQLLRNLEKKETEYMRLQRHKIGIDDFEILTLIGKGAFGENVLVNLNYNEFDLF